MEKSKLLTWLDTKLVLGLCLVLAASVCSYVFYQSRSFDNALSVTGSATKEVMSDKVKWVGSISRTTKLPTLKTGYAALATDLTSVKDFMNQSGITPEEIVISPVFMDQDWSQSQYVNVADKLYILRQTIEVNSDNVDGVTNVTKNIQPLIDKGVIFSTQSLEYTYSKLPEERVALLALAMQDAKARASMLAESTGKQVGKLKSAASGVVQVLSENALNVSDFGTYDTSKIAKTIMVTVKASFTLK
ncbi:SIMPL domain-containing protein [Candidatus Nomurabacteria bacterium]|nr:SIMPL domain-containing protein [Candidatus Nomurabacteria bacterium]